MKKIAVIGTGMMGSSLAVLFTGNGYDTTVLATKEASVQKCKKTFADLYQNLIDQDLLTKEDYEKCAKFISYTTKYEDISDAEIIIECAPESLEIKHGIYAKIEEHCKNFVAIASTTSATDPSDLAKGLKDNKDKIVVAHPFNPPHLVPFVELVRSELSSDQAATAVYDFLEDCGRKVCIMKKSAPGFIANRLQHALLREAIYMVEEGMVDPDAIDKALMYSFMPRYTNVGLFEHQDAAGLDMVKNIEDYMLSDLSDKKCAFDFVNERVARGDLGQKTGQGTYTWTDESKADFKRRAAEPYLKYFNWKLPR